MLQWLTRSYKISIPTPLHLLVTCSTASPRPPCFFHKLNRYSLISSLCFHYSFSLEYSSHSYSFGFILSLPSSLCSHVILSQSHTPPTLQRCCLLLLICYYLFLLHFKLCLGQYHPLLSIYLFPREKRTSVLFSAGAPECRTVPDFPFKKTGHDW